MTSPGGRRRSERYVSRPFNSNDVLFPGGDKAVDCVRFKRFVLDRISISSLLRERREIVVLYVLRPSLWRDEISDETLARTSEDG